MNPKRIGFLGFEGVAASELTRAADVLAAATLDGRYGNRDFVLPDQHDRLYFRIFSR